MWISGWFKKKDRTPKVKPNYFKGYDLNNWTYLGSTELSFYDTADKDQVPYVKSSVYFFVNDTTEEREYVIEKDLDFRRHQYVTHNIAMWKAKIKHLADCISYPSSELIDILAEEGYMHLGGGKWKKTHKDKIVDEKENVVTVNFGVDKE